MQAKCQEYESIIQGLNEKVKEYKQRLREEEEKNMQSNDFDFGDDGGDDVATLNIQISSLTQELDVFKKDLKTVQSDLEKCESDKTKQMKACETAQEQVRELKDQLRELRSLHNKLELENENLKKNDSSKVTSDGISNERVVAANLKQYQELEKKYIQTRK